MKTLDLSFAALGDFLTNYNIRREDMQVRFVLRTIRDLSAFEMAIRRESGQSIDADELGRPPSSAYGIAFEAKTSERHVYQGMKEDRTQAVLNARAAVEKLRTARITPTVHISHVKDAMLQANIALNDLINIIDEPGITPNVITRSTI